MARRSHRLRIAMGTVLLIGETARTDSTSVARRDPLKGALERVGYDVVPAADGAGALARLGQRPPDLIVFAGSVPDMELIDLCAAMRREPVAERTPFVVVADAAGRTGRAASRMGADLVFPPNVGPTEIADRLRRLFQELVVRTSGSISGRKVRDMAAALELPIGTVRSRLNRGRGRLRELLEPTGKRRVRSR